MSLNYTGTRLVIQAFGFIIIKQDHDPLDGIQKLDLIKTVSIFQMRTNVNEEGNEYLGVKWNKLSKEEKKSIDHEASDSDELS